ncbi:MAG: hypothetical protein ACFHX7_24775 [Pseudomonadota bacterium]
MLELVLLVAAILAVVAIYWSIRRQQNRNLSREQHRAWILEAVAAIDCEANRKRLDLNATPKIDIPATFDELRRLTADYPKEIREHIEDMAQTWQTLESHLADYTAQSTASTLQNSILANRTSKLANHMGEVAEKLKTGL